jgi:hypothetical protein
MELISLRTPLELLLISLIAIVACGGGWPCPITLARAPIDPNANCCACPMRRSARVQTPLVTTTQIAPEQIAQDLAQLAKISDCVRTYSIENGLDQVPALAAKVGLKVIQGIWLGSNRLKNLAQISTVVRLTKEYPGVITAVVVGNEVLLRGEMTTSDLAATIRSVKSQVSVPSPMPMSGSIWLRNREVYDAVDFVTIHILPYWEDFPIRAKYAAAHVDAIRKRMAVAFPGKEILIGETGWPSQGGCARARCRRAPTRRAWSRKFWPGQAGEFSRQPDRSLRPAVEAPARGHRRRLLGPDRFASAAVKYPPASHQQLSVLEAADGLRHGTERFRVRRGLADAAAPALDAAAGILDRGRHLRDHRRDSLWNSHRQDVL